MAEIVDDEFETEAPSENESQTEQTQPEVTEQIIEPELPEKYKGKKLEDIVRMHQEAEKKLGAQGQEIGEVRRLADELLRQQLTKKAEVEKPVEIDFFQDPQAAIKQAVSSNPELQTIKQQNEEFRKAQALQLVLSRHADMESVVREPEFAEFVNASPERIAQFQRAANYDANAGIEILNNYKLEKEYRAIKSASVTNTVSSGEKEIRDKAMNAASVDTSGTNESSKKIYRRTDLIKLRMRDPEKYASLADSGELEAAYLEGRVR